MICSGCAEPLPHGALFCGECGRAVAPPIPISSQFRTRPMEVEPERVAVRVPMPEPVQEPEPEPVETPAPATPRSTPARHAPSVQQTDELSDVGGTRIVTGRRAGQRFVLQFSTGESVTVYGTGLVGRNPRPEPGEYFDQLVRVLDPTRSVSKTHLEFGQTTGAFWVRDRFSGNGTIVREPDSTAFRCAPGKRHLVVRGSRVDIGEQFFIVS